MTPFARDVSYLGVFLAVALVDGLVWGIFKRRNSPQVQRPGDVGQLVASCAGGCILSALGIGAMGAAAVMWARGW